MMQANSTPHSDFSTIAELVFLQRPAINFARLVADLDAVLARVHGRDRSLTWDCDGLAFFDMPGTRIGLASFDDPRPGIESSLTISVGPSAIAALPNSPIPRHEALCTKLVERLRGKLDPDAVLWHQSPTPVTADLIDDLSTALPIIPARPKRGHPAFAPLNDDHLRDIYARGFHPANDRPHLPLPKNPELARLRLALYPPAPEPVPGPSTQMRLAAHAMNATLIVVWLPLGAAVMTYSLLKGEDIRLTSRLMVLTGCVGALSQSPLAQQLAAIAGT